MQICPTQPTKPDSGYNKVGHQALQPKQTENMRLTTLHEQETEVISGGGYRSWKQNNSRSTSRTNGRKTSENNNDYGGALELIPSLSTGPITLGWKSQFVVNSAGDDIEDFGISFSNFSV